MILYQITELTIVGIYDRGKPNLERIVIRPNMELDLGRYGLILGVKQSNGMAIPIWDHFFWFGDGLVRPPDWVFIYTGPGQAQQSKTNLTQELAYVLHWGKKQTVLENVNVI